MKINVFFLLVTTALIVIFFALKPQGIKIQKFENIPLLKLSSFTMHELTSDGLITIMKGTEATKYEDRYDVDNINYTDKSKEFIANIIADTGTYKNNIVRLNGNVVYTREDGLTFKTQSASYSKNTHIAKANGNYVLYRDSNKVIGKKLKYNNLSDKIYSTDVTANYKFKER